MRRLKHLLWIVPLFVVVIIAGTAIYGAVARRSDASYHASLTKSVQVSSDGFRGGETIPVEYSCRGAGISPHLKWSSSQATAKSYSLTMLDWDAPSPSLPLFAVVHWVTYNIPADVTELPKQVSVAYLQAHKILVAANIAGAAQYAPPCPPLGTHAYQFRVYALDVDQIHPATNTRAGVMDAMAGHILAYGELIGLRAPGL
jgi:Raf kinase inhibitor-like YbhB/YbcL family protein